MATGPIATACTTSGMPGKQWRSPLDPSDAMPLRSANSPDDDIARHLRVCDDEWPMLIVELRGASIPVREPDARVTVWYGGQANELSKERTNYALIDRIS